MKKLLILPFIIFVFFLQGCSWICNFYIVNTTNEPVTAEIKLFDSVNSFPIFHYSERSGYKLKNNNSVDYENMCVIKADTLEKISHYKVQIPPRSAIAIGQLQNDHYEKHDQYFINGRVFNLEHIVISEKKIEIVPATFDSYFKKGKNNEVYFVL